MIKYSFLLAGIFSLFACVKEVPIDLPPHDSKLAIGCMFGAQDTMLVTVTRSRPRNDTLILIDESIQVYIETEEKKYPLKHLYEGYYGANFVPQVGSKYTINATSIMYGAATASDYVPNPIPFDLVHFNLDGGLDEQGENKSSITIAFQDPAKERNFYELRLYLKSEVLAYDTAGINVGGYDFMYAFLESFDVVIKNEGVINDPNSNIGFLFSDELINGTKHALSFTFSNPYDNPDAATISEVEIQFRHVTETYYRYKKKLYPHLINQFGNPWEGSSNPVSSFSNVTGGYGIFVGYNQREETIVLNEE